MATDQEILNRRRLVKQLSYALDEAPTNQVSNNDVRRLVEHLGVVLDFARSYENYVGRPRDDMNMDPNIGTPHVRFMTLLHAIDKYPREIPLFDPKDVLLPDHVASDVLDRCAGNDLRHTLLPGTIDRIVAHLKVCSACRARLAYFSSKLVMGQHVRLGNPNEPHKPSLDTVGTGSGPTTLNPHIGIAAGSSTEND